MTSCGAAEQSTSNAAQAGAAANSGGAGGAAGGQIGRGASPGQGAGGTGANTNLVVDQLRARSGCFPRALPLAVPGIGVEAGQVSCTITEVTFPIVGATCKCDTKPAAPGVVSAIQKDAQLIGLCGSASGVACDQPCACDLPQLSGAALAQCQTDATTPIAAMPPGFCYVDATATPPLGNPAILSDCPVSGARGLRITGPVPVESQPALFLACTGT